MGAQIPMGMGNIKRERATCCNVYRHSAVMCAKTAKRIEIRDTVWVMDSGGHKEALLDRS